MKKTILLFILILFSFLGYSQVGINTIDPKSTLDINGNLSVKVVSLNGGMMNAATPIDDGVYLNLNPTSNSTEFYVPNAANVPGRIYIMRNISTTENAQIFSAGGLFFYKDSLNSLGTNSPAILPFNGNGKTVYMISDGTNWTIFN